MVVSNRAGYRADRQAEKNEHPIEKLAVGNVRFLRKPKGRISGYIAALLLLILIGSCSWGARQPEGSAITGIGVKDLIELNMKIDEIERDKVPYVKKSLPYPKPDAAFYNADDLGIEFETLNDIVVRIWFFAERNCTFRLLMPVDKSYLNLNSIRANDILKNFGEAKKYVDQYPPKNQSMAVWAKYQSFGIAINTIDYPDTPFHFGLNQDDVLSYVTVSKKL